MMTMPAHGSSSIAGLVAACVVLSTHSANAQPPAPKPRDTPADVTYEPVADIDPPMLASEAHVPYPEGGKGSARVVLELSISKDGAVVDAIAREGGDPFTAAAIAAAKTWRFEPATRDGAAVAARVLFEVEFVQPSEKDAEPAPTDSETETAAATDRAAPKPEETYRVSVTGERPAPGKATLDKTEVRQLPGAFGDPFRALDALPGVTPIATGLPFFFVRGAPPGNLGYFIDGVRVPLLFHLGLGPGVVHPGMVERVDVYPGGYPARLGRFAGGVVEAETTAPRKDFHGEANVRLVDSGALLEGGFAGDRGTALVGGRYSYTALLLSLIVPEITLQYWDYQTRLTYDLDDENTLGLFAFGSFDYLGEDQGDGIETLLGVHFHRIDLRWTKAASRRTRLASAVTFGYDRTDAGGEDVSIADRMLAWRGQVDHVASNTVLFRTGADATMDAYTLDRRFGNEEDAELNALFPTRTDFAGGVWADTVVDADPQVTVTPGLRADLFHQDGVTAIGVDPRIAALYRVTDSVRFEHTLGVAHQPPAFVIPVPGLAVADLRDGLQRSVQSSGGVEVDLGSDFTSSVTLFHNAFFGMTDALGTGGFGNEEENVTVVETDMGPTRQIEQSPSDAERLTTRSLGQAYGVELSIKRPLSRKLGGFLSYTLSRTTRSFGREKFPASFDRTHVFNTAVGYDLGKRWRAGGRFAFYTGRPSSGTDAEGLRPSSPNRLPPFFRLDVRLEKRWRLGERGYWALVFEVLNATLSKEVINDSCDVDLCEREEIGPVTIPSIGLEAFF